MTAKTLPKNEKILGSLPTKETPFMSLNAKAARAKKHRGK